jgi:hypothetical protein
LDKFEIDIPITKTEPAKRLVFGYANVPVARDGSVIVDRHNEEIDSASLEKAAYDYVLYYREGGEEHKKLGVARLVESVFLTAEKVKAMGLDDPTFSGSAWWVGFKVSDDETWKKVESGALRCFSIGGTATAEEIE